MSKEIEINRSLVRNRAKKENIVTIYRKVRTLSQTVLT